ncbi:MAG: mechanosensitive ion channel family protein [Ruminococcus sp.]|nr:mechanosensitive ion channel family protein [Candidatus Copronaster equi]
MISSIKQWSFENLPEKLYIFLPKILSFVLILVIGFWISNKLGKLLVTILNKRNVDKSVHRFLQRFLTVILKIVVAVIALEQLGFNLNSFITAIGAAGITAGLGLQNSIAQFASGVQILFNKPFKSGDYIEVDGIEGKVKEIRFMYTVLVTRDNKEIVIPNQNITTNHLTNYTSLENRRIEFTFSIGYDENIDKAKKVLLNVATSNSHILNSPKPEVAVSAHAESSVNLVLHAWCKSDNYWNSFYSVQEEVKKAFDKNKINIPFNQLDVHMV